MLQWLGSGGHVFLLPGLLSEGELLAALIEGLFRAFHHVQHGLGYALAVETALGIRLAAAVARL